MTKCTRNVQCHVIFHIPHLVVVHGGQELEHGEDDAAVDQDGLHHAALVERQTARGCLLLVTRGPGGRGLGTVLRIINNLIHKYSLIYSSSSNFKRLKDYCFRKQPLDLDLDLDCVCTCLLITL